MTKKLKLGATTRTVDLHPRAERLLTDANIDVCNDTPSGIIDQPEDVQRARIAAQYQRAVKIAAQYQRSDAAVRAPLTERGEYLVLPRHAIDVINGVITRLAEEADHALIDLLAQSHKLGNALAEGVDFADFDALSERDDKLDARAWNAREWARWDALPEAEKDRQMREMERDMPLNRPLVVTSKGKVARTPEQEKAHAIELQAREERARDKRAGVHPAPISWYVMKIRNAAVKPHGGSK